MLLIYQASDRYLKALDEKGDATRPINTLSFMEDQTRLNTQMSYLVRFLTFGHVVFIEVGRAYRAEEGPSTASEDVVDFFAFYGSGYASMLWGCGCGIYEMAKRDMWRKAFEARILDELNMLDDENPPNDMAGLLSPASFSNAENVKGKVQEQQNGDEEDKEEHNLDHDKEYDDQNEEHDRNDGHDREEIEAEQPEGGANALSERKAETDEGADHGLTFNDRYREEAVQAKGKPDADTSSDTDPPPPLIRRPTDHVEQTTINSEARLALSLDTAWSTSAKVPAPPTTTTTTSLYSSLNSVWAPTSAANVYREKLVCRNCSSQHALYQAWPILERKAEIVAEGEGKKMDYTEGVAGCVDGGGVTHHGPTAETRKSEDDSVTWQAPSIPSTFTRRCLASRPTPSVTEKALGEHEV
ncbi:MAG: hypothetical protein Q9188_003953 [Gyalolechia gomerana]